MYVPLAGVVGVAWVSEMCGSMAEGKFGVEIERGKMQPPFTMAAAVS